MTVDTNKLIGNTDASVWADEWCDIATELRDGGTEIIDWGWMIGWFANAIMAGFDEGAIRSKLETARLKYALDHGWNRAQFEYANEKDLWEDDELAAITPAIKHERRYEVFGVGPTPGPGSPVEYELVTHSGQGGIPVTEVVPINPTEHLYSDEDIGALAQEIEDLYDVLGDLITNSHECAYDETEFCVEHNNGRPCPFDLARRLVNGK